MWPSCVLRPIAAMASRLMQTHDPAAFCPLNSRRICAVDEWWLLLLLLRLVLAFGSRKLAHIYIYIYIYIIYIFIYAHFHEWSTASVICRKRLVRLAPLQRMVSWILPYDLRFGA